MSTSYAPIKKVRAYDLFDGRLEEAGVREAVTDDTTPTSRCLTDGRNYLWVNITEDGYISNLRRYGGNAPSKILSALAQAFDTDIVSEYEPQYWGFQTEEEWDAWQLALAKEGEEEFYTELMRFLRGEPNDIRPGTIGLLKAEVAKSLVDKDQSLLLPENKDRLLKEMDAIYDRDHAVRVTLNPDDIALADMIATHEDDLPRA